MLGIFKKLFSSTPKIISTEIDTLGVVAILDEYILSKNNSSELISGTVGDLLNTMLHDVSSVFFLDFIEGKVSVNIKDIGIDKERMIAK